MDKLTHTDDKGKAIMVDIGEKRVEHRCARAIGHIRLSSETLKLIEDNLLKKGDVLAVAQIAGINAAKRTAELIPLCHNITLESISVLLFPDQSGITVESEIKCTGKTGAEMEALTAACVALLTVYDMCKAVDKFMVIDKIEMIEKSKNEIPREN